MKFLCPLCGRPLKLNEKPHSDSYHCRRCDLSIGSNFGIDRISIDYLKNNSKTCETCGYNKKMFEYTICDTCSRNPNNRKDRWTSKESMKEND